LAVALAGVCSTFRLAKLFQRLYITGALLLAIAWPLYAIFIFSGL
jgi:hypothetical protein